MIDIEKAFTNILSIVLNSKLYPNQIKIIRDNMQSLSVEISRLIEENKKYKSIISGTKLEHDIALKKAIDILDLLGFTPVTFEGLNVDFLNWFINARPAEKFEGRLFNYYLLESWMMAYLSAVLIYDREPTYDEVRTLLLDKSQIDQASKLAYIEKMTNLIDSFEAPETKKEHYKKMIQR